MEPITPFEAPRQLPLALDSSMLRGLAAAERAKAVTLLAQLLLEAGDRVEGEEDDDEF